MIKRKKTIFISALAILVTVLIVAFSMGAAKEEPSTDETSVERPSVVIKPPQTSPSETDAPPEPLPYEGKTFTVLGVYDEDRYLGDIEGEGPNTVSQISYARNLRICAKYGVEIVFKYTLDVYAEVSSAIMSGGEPPSDLLNVNMLSDASSFLMKGGTFNLLDSGIDLTGEAYCKPFVEYFTQNGKCPFIIGSANPSLYGALYAMAVKEDSAAVPHLDTLLSEDSFTYDEVISAFKTASAAVSLDAKTLHVLSFGDSLFGFDGEEQYVRTDEYTEAYSSVLGWREIFSAQGTAADAYISAYTDIPTGYKAYPIPAAYGTGRQVDPSRLYAFAVPANISEEDKSMVFTVTDAFYSESVGIYVEEYESIPALIDADEHLVFCFYTIFGWGDFSDHAFKAFLEEKSAAELSASLVAPDTVSHQALKILLERYN